MKQLLFLSTACWCLLMAACQGNGQGGGNAADSVYRKPHNSVSKGCDTFQSQHYQVPKQLGWVNDYEHLLRPDDTAVIATLCRQYRQETGNQLVVVTITPIMVPKPVFDCYATLLANTWAIGDKGKDNGIVVSVSQEEAQMRIDIGKGLEQKISNEATKAIIDTAFVPSFTKDKYGAGIIKGIKVLMQAVR